jgi:hypothetical protein
VIAKSKRRGLGRWAITMVAKRIIRLIQNTHPPSGKPGKKSITLLPIIILDEN